MDNFAFSYPAKVYFGRGAMEQLRTELAQYGERVLLAYGGGSLKKTGVYDQVTSLLLAAGKTVVEFPSIMPNPAYAKVQEGVALVREKGVDFILAVGGGSVIDCCKIVSAQAKLEEDIWEMETVKKRFPMEFVLMGAVVTAFPCHQLEHQLGAYTDCNHGQALAVIHPVLYRHICEAGEEKVARFARNVWGIAERATAEEPPARKWRLWRTLSRKWACPPALRRWVSILAQISRPSRIPPTLPPDAAGS